MPKNAQFDDGRPLHTGMLRTAKADAARDGLRAEHEATLTDLDTAKSALKLARKDGDEYQATIRKLTNERDALRNERDALRNERDVLAANLKKAEGK